MKKHLTVGILAHVDSGKTTLAEAILHLTGSIRNPGRVDHGNTHLDTHELERERGITIFSSEASVSTEKYIITLLDTPGHVDFSTETERALSVLDAAILVISGFEGVQTHTETLWSLLRRHAIPTFIFINKTDIPTVDRDAVFADIQKRLDGGAVDMTRDGNSIAEAVSLLDEVLLERYLDGGEITDDDIRGLIASCRLFPCIFGSALRQIGVTELIGAIDKYAPCPDRSEEFGARVYKISRDEKGGRLTHLKLTGGTLAVRYAVTYTGQDGEKTEKITSIRCAVGAKQEAVTEAEAGMICAVSGLSATYPGQGLGAQTEAAAPTLEPVLEYRILLPAGCDVREYYPKIKVLEEEDPQLRITYNDRLGEIYVRLMGEVQTEILKRVIKSRIGIDVSVDSGRIMYRETVAAPVAGVGHFEPLRHYAEVHLYLEPTGPGTGLTFRSACSINALSRHWQRLILSHLRERTHKGVLTGSPITDMRITLIAGRAHAKHTEGGDFRQATYRAVRQALMSARSVLLEPYYAYKISVPTQQIGKVITDVRNMSGTFGSPVEDGNGFSTLTGRAPVAAMRNYASEIVSFTRGTGKFSFEVCGYYPCHNPEDVIKERSYDPEADLAHTPDSVFCAHGAGFNVKWDRVRDYMHITPAVTEKPEQLLPSPRSVASKLKVDDRELEAIMEREFGPIRRRQYGARKVRDYRETAHAPKKNPDYYIIDGYNVIFAWDELKKAADGEIDLARSQLISTLASFRAYKNCDLLLVFDAYNVKDGTERRYTHEGIDVVYTGADETADAYIERLIREIGKSYYVKVVTSDALLQLSALSGGVMRMSAREFRTEVTAVSAEITALIESLDAPMPRDEIKRDIPVTEYDSL